MGRLLSQKFRSQGFQFDDNDGDDAAPTSSPLGRAGLSPLSRQSSQVPPPGMERAWSKEEKLGGGADMWGGGSHLVKAVLKSPVPDSEPVQPPSPA